MLGSLGFLTVSYRKGSGRENLWDLRCRIAGCFEEVFGLGFSVVLEFSFVFGAEFLFRLAMRGGSCST